MWLVVLLFQKSLVMCFMDKVLFFCLCFEKMEKDNYLWKKIYDFGWMKIQKSIYYIDKDCYLEGMLLGRYQMVKMIKVQKKILVMWQMVQEKVLWCNVYICWKVLEISLLEVWMFLFLLWLKVLQFKVRIGIYLFLFG